MATQERKKLVLHVRVYEGRDLVACDRGGTSDPYCLVTVGANSRRTKTIKKTLNPNWIDVDPEPFRFEFDPQGPPTEILFEVFDWNKFQAHKRMGVAHIPVTDLYREGTFSGTIDKWVPLQKVKETDHVSGELKLSIGFDENSAVASLFSAIKNSDLKRVEELVGLHERRGMEIDVNAKDEHGYTPLHAACCVFSENDDQVLSCLLHHELINVNIENQDKNTPLHYFCEKFRSPNCTEAFEIFIKKGANVNAQNKNGETPLHKAIFNNSVRILMVNLLISNKADVNKVNLMGETPLHYAVYLGREDLVSILLKAGGDITIRGIKENKTPHDLAVQQKLPKIATILERAKEISEWLDSIGLGGDQYRTTFLKHDITKDLLPKITEKDLDRMGITTAGHRLKLMKNVKLLKEQHPGEGVDPNNNAPSSGSSGSTKENKDGDSQIATPSSGSSSSSTTGSGDAVVTPAVSNNTSSLEEELEKMMKYSNKAGGIWNVHHSELEFTVKLGSGAAGIVYRGIYKGQDVAIKVLKTDQQSKELDEFKKEFQIMGSIQSPYTVFFYGACLSPKMCMIMEFCSRGSLYDVMNDRKIHLTWEHVFQFSKEMIKGMDCLHTWDPQVVHRDFKSLNLMVNEQFHVKVGDFGLSRFNTETQKETLVKMRGTFAYCAPEVYFGNKFSTKSDVFSIGVVLWELVNRILKGVYERPYQEYPNLRFDFQIIIQTAKNKLRPTIKETCPESFVQLIRESWDHEIDVRPSCRDMYERLEKIEQEYLADKASWDKLCEVAPPQ